MPRPQIDRIERMVAVMKHATPTGAFPSRVDNKLVTPAERRLAAFAWENKLDVKLVTELILLCGERKRLYEAANTRRGVNNDAEQEEVGKQIQAKSREAGFKGVDHSGLWAHVTLPNGRNVQLPVL